MTPAVKRQPVRDPHRCHACLGPMVLRTFVIVKDAGALGGRVDAVTKREPECFYGNSREEHQP